MTFLADFYLSEKVFFKNNTSFDETLDGKKRSTLLVDLHRKNTFSKATKYEHK